MELSANTISVLKNYSTINPNVLIKEGNELSTISEAKNLVSSSRLDVNFPKTFGIYDLNEFLSVVSLIDSPRLKFENDFMYVLDGTGTSRIKYYYSDLDLLTTPSSIPKMPDAEVKFRLDRTTLSKIKKASSVLGHSEVSISNNEESLILSVVDINDSTSNVFSIDIDGEYDKNVNFNLIYNINNLKMVEGDYDVKISSLLISHFTNINSNIEYWVALEKTSTYGE